MTIRVKKKADFRLRNENVRLKFSQEHLDGEKYFPREDEITATIVVVKWKARRKSQHFLGKYNLTREIDRACACSSSKSSMAENIVPFRYIKCETIFRRVIASTSCWTSRHQVFPKITSIYSLDFYHRRLHYFCPWIPPFVSMRVALTSAVK